MIGGSQYNLWRGRLASGKRKTSQGTERRREISIHGNRECREDRNRYQPAGIDKY